MDEIKEFYQEILQIKDENILDILASHSTIQIYKRNESIFNGNLGPQLTIPFLVEGAAKIYSSNLKNDITTYIGYSKGDSFILFSLDNLMKDYDGWNVEAIKKDTKLIHLEMSVMQELYDEFPEEYNRIIIHYLNVFMNYHFKIGSIRAVNPSKKRVEELLKIFPDLVENNLYGIAQEHFANLIGLPRQTFNTCYTKITRKI